MRDLLNYFKAVFTEGQRVVLTAFDIIGLILFLYPSFVQKFLNDEEATRIFGAIVFFISFILANFLLYKKLSKSTESITKKNLSFHPYKNPPYNAVEMKYVGNEPIDNINIILLYKDKEGKKCQKLIEEFFPKNDRNMILEQFKANFLDDNDVVRFRLLNIKSVLEPTVTLDITFEGARTRKVIKMRKDFTLEL